MTALTALSIAALDTTTLSVAIPSIMRDLDADLPAVQWAVTGNSLVYAALLVVGGRLGDVHGHRRVFVTGLVLIAVGSLGASQAPTVELLVAGKSLLVGGGSALMVPATFALISRQFRGPERARAFAATGAVIGAGVALGPFVGGLLTTSGSWRLATASSGLLALVALAGAFAFMPSDSPSGARDGLDLGGAVLAAGGLLVGVFCLSQGQRYGWLASRRPLELLGRTVWSDRWAISPVAPALAVAGALLVGFHRLERRREEAGRSVLFGFGELRRKGFRYGLLTGLVMSMGHVSLIFVIPLLLQSGRGFTAAQAGLWLVPSGLCMIASSQVGARLAGRYSTVAVVRLGLVLEAAGIGWVALTLGPDFGARSILVGLALYGCGIGMASSQLTNVTVADVPVDRSGMAVGGSSTARQLGTALGIAVMGTLLNGHAISRATAAVTASPSLSSGVRADVLAELGSGTLGARPPAGASAVEAGEIHRAVAEALAGAGRSALLFAAATVAAGAVLAWRIPRQHEPEHSPGETVAPAAIP